MVVFQGSDVLSLIHPFLHQSDEMLLSNYSHFVRSILQNL